MRIGIPAVLLLCTFLYGCNQDEYPESSKALKDALDSVSELGEQKFDPPEHSVETPPIPSYKPKSSTDTRSDNLTTLKSELSLCEQHQRALQNPNVVSTMERLLWISLTIISVLVTIIVKSRKHTATSSTG